ncbi:MAG: hypothetical protein QM820_51185 [Minicystis sp.]
MALLAVGGVIGSSACVQNESSLFIRGCLNVPRESCDAQAATNASFIYNGSIDGLYAAAGQYQCLALIENQLVVRGDPTKLRVETSRISVYEAEVQVLTNDPNNPQALAQFTVPVSGFADPGTGTEPGLGLTNIVLVDYATLKSLAMKAQTTNQVQSVVASAILHGRTLGGLELTSNEFRFPIDISGGRACTVPVGDTCYGSSQKPSDDCKLGQDGLVDCRFLDPCTYLVCKPLPSPGVGPDLTTATCPNPAGLGDGSCCG